MRYTDRAFQPPSASARYFIIKRRVSWLTSRFALWSHLAVLCLRSYNHENIGTSISNGVWATQAHNEKKLADAFDSGEEARRALERPASLCQALTTCFSRVLSQVVLIFSVNSSGHFQGYARMVTRVGSARGRWTGDAAALGATFGIQWECLYDLPFAATSHLYNPLNEGKPVKISRDGTELPGDIGAQMVAMIEAGAAQVGLPRPKLRPEGPPEEEERGDERRAPREGERDGHRDKERSAARGPERGGGPPQGWGGYGGYGAPPPGNGAWGGGGYGWQGPGPQGAVAAPSGGRGEPRRSRSRSRERKHRSRSRSPRRARRRSRSRSREGGRGRGGDNVADMSYEEYQKQYLDYCAQYMRGMGWDGRGGMDGMTAFWNANAGGGGGGGPQQGWGGPPGGGGWGGGPPAGWGGRGGGPQGGGRGGGGRGRGADNLCYRCGGTDGHWARNCPNPDTSGRGPRR